MKYICVPFFTLVRPNLRNSPSFVCSARKAVFSSHIEKDFEMKAIRNCTFYYTVAQKNVFNSLFCCFRCKVVFYLEYKREFLCSIFV